MDGRFHGAGKTVHTGDTAVNLAKLAAIGLLIIGVTFFVTIACGLVALAVSGCFTSC